MNQATRAVTGAIVGALIVLVLHPKSRPYVLGGYLFAERAKVAEVTQNLPENLPSLPQPEAPAEASLWLQAAAEQDLAGKRLTVDQAILLAEIAQQGQKAEPDNAYWPQMESVFVGIALKASGKDKGPTLLSWLNASHCSMWNDHQIERLAKVQQELDKRAGAPFAWHSALAYSRRSAATTQRMLVQSRAILADTKGSMSSRVANIENGALIRDGSRSVQGGIIGTTMIDLAVVEPANLRTATTPKTESEAKGRLLSELASNPDTRRAVAKAIASNEAWLAFAPTKDYQLIAIRRARMSVLTATLPGVLITIGGLGTLTYLLGAFLAKNQRYLKPFEHPWAFIVGALAGVATYLLTGLVFAALWTTAAISGFCLAPDRLRSGQPTGLGAVFRGTLYVLALGVSLGVAAHLIETSVPAQQIGDFATMPGIQGSGLSVPLNLAVLGLTFVLATSPVWGYLYRYPASRVLPESLKIFGSALAIGTLSLSVVATPFCLAIDKDLSTSFTEMLANEPNHYLAHPSR